MTAKYSFRHQRGAWKISITQGLVFVLLALCLGVLYNTYRSNTDPPRSQPVPLPVTSRTQKQLGQNVEQWQGTLVKQSLTLTCPYLGQDYVARIDLPERRPITLDPWDYPTEAQIAAQGYSHFVKARRQARVAIPEGCMVHVFDATGEEVARASQAGVVTSQFAPIPGT